MKHILATTLILIVGCFGADVAEAGRSVAAEAVLKVYCSDKNGSAHPKRSTLTHFITTKSFKNRDDVQLLLSYESTQCCLGVPGTIKGSASRESPDGASDEVGNVTVKTDPVVVAGAGLIDLDGGLARGTSLLWDLRFSGFEKLREDECFNILSAVTADSTGE